MKFEKFEEAKKVNSKLDLYRKCRKNGKSLRFIDLLEIIRRGNYGL